MRGQAVLVAAEMGAQVRLALEAQEQGCPEQLILAAVEVEQGEEPQQEPAVLAAPA